MEECLCKYGADSKSSTDAITNYYSVSLCSVLLYSVSFLFEEKLFKDIFSQLTIRAVLKMS